MEIVPYLLHFAEHRRIHAVEFLKLVDDERHRTSLGHAQHRAEYLAETLRLSEDRHTKLGLDFGLQRLAQRPLVLPRDQDIDKGVFAVVERLFDELGLPDAPASGYDGEFRPLMRRLADSPQRRNLIFASKEIHLILPF